MEDVWKWLLRFLFTTILLLVIGLLALAVASVPRIWDTIDATGDAVRSIEPVTRDVSDTLNEMTDAIETLSQDTSETLDETTEAIATLTQKTSELLDRLPEE